MPVLTATSWFPALVAPVLLVSGQTPVQCPQCVSLLVGPPVLMGGPTGSAFDSPFAAIQVTQEDGSSTLRGYSANAHSYMIVEGASLADTLPVPVPVGLEPNPSPAALDHCGEWLNAALVDQGAADAALEGGRWMAGMGWCALGTTKSGSATIPGTRTPTRASPTHRAGTVA